MAFDLRLTTVCFTLYAAACGGDSSAAVDTDPTGGSEGTGPGACIPGYEGCGCAEGVCLHGLQCLSDLCVENPDPSTSGVDPTLVDPSQATAEAGESTDTSADESSGDESSSSGSSSDSSSSESSSSTAAEPGCFEHDHYCSDTTLQTCIDGDWHDSTCEDECGATGYLSPGCANEDACLCEGFADAACDNAAYNLCVCADAVYDLPCTDQQLIDFYNPCFDMSDPVVMCFLGSTIDSVQDCEALFAVCL